MSSHDTDAEPLEISDLPLKVLQRIFKYLSIEERKAVKLVCKLWLECCNVDEEILVCRAIYQLSDIYQLLDKSNRKCLNLKFQRVTFDYSSLFWKRNGWRIRSIYFENSRFPNGILKDIIVSCKNLFHLSFTFTSSFRYDKDLPSPIKDLEKIAKKGIIHEDLESLEIFQSEKLRLSDYILHQLLFIFPKVKILRITCDFCSGLADGIDINLSEVTNKNRLTFSPVFNYLISSSERIEKVKLNLPYANFSSSSLRRILKIVSSLKRLTELCITTFDKTVLEGIDINFCSKQIKSLEFGMSLGFDDLMLFLSKLLLPNSGLQRLKIEQSSCNPFILTKSLYEKLMSSGLKCFVFTNFEDCSIQDVNSFTSCSSAQQLRTSVLPSLPTSISLNERPAGILYFLQYYKTLHHLKLDYIHDDELQFLFKYQKELRSLYIDSYKHSNMNIRVGDLGFNELAGIECLEFLSPLVSFFFLRTLSPKPILSKLKYLYIDSSAVGKMLLPTDLLRAADGMPFLEGLYLSDRYYPVMSFDDIVKLCTKLSRLRYLQYVGDWLVNDGALTDEHYNKVFSICPSLRVLIHCHPYLNCEYGPDWHPSDWHPSDCKTYLFDTLNKKVVLKQDNRRYTFGRPKIGEFTVSWLKF